MLAFMIIGFLVIVFTDSSVSLTVMVSPGKIVGRVGSTVTLPCWLSPVQSAEALEIRWYRPDQFNTPVLFYRDGKIQDVQDERYKNRSSLSKRSAQSGGLQEGDVSLQLENLNAVDAGVFHCYASGDRSYDSQAVILNITALGSIPVLFPKPVDAEHINISCSSSGWFPEPKVIWMSNDRTLLPPGGVTHSRRADKLLSTHSWVIISKSDFQLVSCLLSLSSGEKREGRINLQAIIPSVTSDPWKALFLILVACVVLGLVGFIFYKYRDKLTGKKPHKKAENQTPPLSGGGDMTMKELREDAVHITLDPETAHPDLKITKDCKIVRDSPDYVKHGTEFPYELCVCGAQTFNSGRVYWEVELAQNNVSPKSNWLIGVMKQSNFRVKDKSRLTTSSGFWFLCLDGPNGFYANTEPPVKLSLSPTPERVGVLLDYDKGQLSFFIAGQGEHFLTMNTKFSGSVVPLFNPGVGDQSALKILDIQKPEAEPESTEPLLAENSQV